MPSTYAHFVFGKKVFRKQPEKVRELIRNNRWLYLIGLHGPDILFYYKALTSNPVNTVGFSQHDRPAAEFFEPAAAVCSRLSGGRREAALSYLLGFICHFALDSMCHGYVEKKIHVSGISHTEIEVEFDRMLMVRDGLDPLRHSLTGHIRPTAGNAAVIADFFPDITQEQAERALRSMVWYNRLLLAPGAGKRALICAVLKLSGNYEAMRGQLVNRTTNPACLDSSIRLEKLMEKAVPLSVRLSGNFLDFLEKSGRLDPYFEKTFGAGSGWREIPVLSLQEELRYEV